MRTSRRTVQAKGLTTIRAAREGDPDITAVAAHQAMFLFRFVPAGPFRRRRPVLGASFRDCGWIGARFVIE
jgi:hypothetical protein